jgi:hypothetical protein
VEEILPVNYLYLLRLLEPDLRSVVRRQ